jgi:hypothetical protein
MVYSLGCRPRIAALETRMSSSSSVASQPPIAYTPPANDVRAQAAKAAADDKAAEKATEKSAKVEETTAAKPQAAKQAGKGQVLDIQA